MSSRLVLGLVPFVDVACNAWRRARPDLEIRRFEAHQAPDYTFDEASLDALGADVVPVFVAIDNRFLNFKRTELIRLVRARGVRLDSIVGLHAIIGDGAIVGDNAFIGEGAVIGDGASIGEGACIGARCVVGPGAVVEPGAWLESGVVIGARARIGVQTSVASGVVIADDAEIGELCVLAVPGLIRGEVRAKTYVHPAFDEPIRIV